MILSIDTSDRFLGVDLSVDGRSLARRTVDRPRIHASLLLPTVLDLMQEIGSDMAALGAVAVAKGPGSYTGLRIGVSSAKGLTFALGIPLIGVPTMDALGVAFANAFSGETRLVTCLASRRREVYAQAWHVADTLQALSEVEALTLDAVEPFLDRVGVQETVIVGSGSEQFIQATQSGARTVRESPIEIASNAVHGVSQIAAERLSKGLTDDVSSFEPFYLKDFVAKVGASPFAAARNR